MQRVICSSSVLMLASAEYICALSPSYNSPLSTCKCLTHTGISSYGTEDLVVAPPGSFVGSINFSPPTALASVHFESQSIDKCLALGYESSGPDDFNKLWAVNCDSTSTHLTVVRRGSKIQLQQTEHGRSSSVLYKTCLTSTMDSHGIVRASCEDTDEVAEATLWTINSEPSCAGLELV